MSDAPTIQHPYLLFLGDAHDELAGKTARGVAQWRPEWCVGQWRLPGCQPNLGLPDLRPAEAAARGARTMIIGVANAGGVLPESWTPWLLEALEAVCPRCPPWPSARASWAGTCTTCATRATRTRWARAAAARAGAC
jgi:hypothetical protein